MREDSRHSSAMLQFHRHTHSDEDDLGNAKKDQFYVVLTGIGSIDWGNKDMRTCFERFQVGAMEVTEATPSTDNHAKCAAWDKDLGW